MNTLINGVIDMLKGVAKAVALVVFLLAFIGWAKTHPEQAQQMLTKILDTAAQVINWALNLVAGSVSQ